MHRNLSAIFITALAILGSYEAGLRLLAPAVDSGQDQFATNVIRLENYADHAAGVDTAIVGTSLSARLPDDVWPAGWRVLSQSGGSGLTGLKVIAAMRPLPRRILIETNFLELAADQVAIDNATGVWGHWSRRLFWLSRTAYKPMNLLTWVGRSLRKPAVSQNPPSAFDELLTGRRRDFSVPPSPTTVATLESLKPLIESLAQQGIRIAFFELPVEASLLETPRAVGMRETLHRLFPEPAYCWLTIGSGPPWHTTDGVHLLVQDARRAASNLKTAACDH